MGSYTGQPVSDVLFSTPLELAYVMGRQSCALFVGERDHLPAAGVCGTLRRFRLGHS
jgi:hypothetical protein